MNKKIITIIAVILLIVAIAWAGWYFLSDKNDDISNIDPSQYLVFEPQKDDLSQYQEERMFETFSIAKDMIEKNGDNYSSDKNFYAWLDIAGAQKTIGDYQRASLVWQWFTQAYPGNSISPANLADLYKTFIEDKEKSEEYYKIALEREKHDFQLYYGFFELYRYKFESPEKALAVLREGQEKNPTDSRYISEIASYLISLDRKEEAEQLIEDYISKYPNAEYLREIVQ